MKYVISLLLALFLTVYSALAPSNPQDFRPFSLLQSAEAKQELVYFNTKTYKYHSQDCIWAHRCTRNCILIPLSDAIKRGGIPCKVCGG